MVIGFEIEIIENLLSCNGRLKSEKISIIRSSIIYKDYDIELFLGHLKFHL